MVTQRPMQECVQLAVLTLIAEEEFVDPIKVAQMCPRSDTRDLARAIQLLALTGAIDGPDLHHPTSALLATQSVSVVALTDEGRARLARG